MTSNVMTVGPGGAIYPEGNLQPPMAALWWPLYSGTGVTDGSTTPSGFEEMLGETIATRTEPLIVDTHIGTLSYSSIGGLTFPVGGRNMLYMLPTGDNLTFCNELFDLGAYVEGETLLIGFELETPAGWAEANTGSFIVASFGDHNTTGGSWRIGINSSELGTFQYKAVGTSAGYTAQNINSVTSLAFADSCRNAIVFEIQCVDTNTFTVIGYSGQTADNVTAGTLSASTDMSDPGNSGTAAPGLGTTPRITLGGRYDTNAIGSVTSAIAKGEILRNFWAVRSYVPLTASAATRACRDMLTYRGKFPRSIRMYTGVEDEEPEVSDGAWSGVIGDITDADTYVALCPERTYAAHPQFTVVTPSIRLGDSLTDPTQKTGDWSGGVSSKNIEAQIPPLVTPNKLPDGRDTATYYHYRSDKTPPGLQHVEDTALGTKFGRSTTGPDGLGPALYLAADNSDTTEYRSSRHRCEAAYRGTNVRIPYNEDLWIGLRAWYDFDMDASPQHSAIMQIHPMINVFYETGGINPNLAVTIYQTELKVTTWGSNADPILKVASTGVATTTAPTRGAWFDLVIKTKLSNLTADNPYTHAWLNGTQFATLSAINMYRENDTQPQKREIRCGIYPGQGTMAPDVQRVIWVKRMIVAKNVGNYSAAQIRAALTATLP